MVNKLTANNTFLYSLIPSIDLSELSAIATKYNNDDYINIDNKTAWNTFQFPCKDEILSNKK